VQIILYGLVCGLVVVDLIIIVFTIKWKSNVYGRKGLILSIIIITFSEMGGGMDSIIYNSFLFEAVFKIKYPVYKQYSIQEITWSNN
jgi:hypothetical protein